ncbi:hypothetical protein FRC03_007847 [Tulasnella sp. 419]|nr:hypothetical protein FRC03_007847 [Tulasnella sp. 419]
MEIETPQITVEAPTLPPSPSTFRPQIEVTPEPMSFGNTAEKTTTSPPSSQGQRGDRGSGGRGQGRTSWTGKDKQAPLFQQAETTTLRNDDRPVASSSRIIAAQESKGSLIDRIHSSDSPPSGSNPPPASHLPPRPNIPRTMSLKERMDGEKRKRSGRRGARR